MQTNHQLSSLRPIRVPFAWDAYKIASRMKWFAEEVDMHNDVDQFQNGEINDNEKRVIGGVLRGFTLIEQVVGDYWSDIVAKSFYEPEIIMMAREFASQECTHIVGYDYLDSTLGIDSYAAFLQEPTAVEKLESLVNQIQSDSDLLTSLAIFSGAVEGVSLYGSFSVLLSFSRFNKMKGLGRILGWSINDEAFHSEMGINLYHHLRQSRGWTPNIDAIYDGFEQVVGNEIAFINAAYKDGDLESITRSQAIGYVYYRANDRLTQLGLKPKYLQTESGIEVANWMSVLVDGVSSGDFFAGKLSDEYSTHVEQNFLKIPYQNKRNIQYAAA